MSPQLQQLEEQVLRLPQEDREVLADALLHSREQAPATEVDEAWIAEAERRFQGWRSGQSTAVPADEFFFGVRRELGWL